MRSSRAGSAAAGDLRAGFDHAVAAFDSTRDAEQGAVADRTRLSVQGRPLPGPLDHKAAETVGVDRVPAMRAEIYSARSAGTTSLIGIHSGQADPFLMGDLFDYGRNDPDG